MSRIAWLREQRQRLGLDLRRSGGRRPSNVDTSSVVSSRYGVSSAPSGSSSWYANSGMGQKVPCSEEDPMTESGYRVEHDSMGEVRVPAEAQWGAQTQRAVENFPISGRPIDRRARSRALALIKAEAAARQRSSTGPTKRRRSRPRPRRSRAARTTTSSRSTCSRPARARRRT